MPAMADDVACDGNTAAAAEGKSGELSAGEDRGNDSKAANHNQNEGRDQNQPLTKEQKRDRLARKRTRLEWEVAQRKLAAARSQRERSVSLLAAARRGQGEQEEGRGGDAGEDDGARPSWRNRQNHPPPPANNNNSKKKKRRRGGLPDLTALRRTSLVVRDIASSGPRELVYIRPSPPPTEIIKNDPVETKDDLPALTPRRREKKRSELQRRQREVLERRAELLRKKADMLQRQQQKEQQQKEEEEGERRGKSLGRGEKADGGEEEKVAAAELGGEGADTSEEDLVGAGDEVANDIINEGDGGAGGGGANEAENDNDGAAAAANEAENIDDGDEDDGEADRIERLLHRRRELQSTLTQQAQTQTELRQSIEVQNLRGMVRTQLGVLTKQGRTLADRTDQLKRCAADLDRERMEVEEAERRMVELRYKKVQLERMAGMVTDGLLECRQRRADVLAQGDDGHGGNDGKGRSNATDSSGPIKNRSRSSPQGGRQRRSKRRGGAAADFFFNE